MSPVLPAALLIAWALDALFGEPRDAWHPVAWLGRVLGPLGSRLCRWRAALAFSGGALAWLLMAGLLGAAAYGLQQMLLQWPAPVAALLLACVLKPCFAWRMLRDEVAAVETGAGPARWPTAGSQLARLVSRDVTGSWMRGEVRETAIETLAENLNDSVVAPLFWFAVAGLPGAVVYRFANTADAMWGYRGRYGNGPASSRARADDVLSWLPARPHRRCCCGPGHASGCGGRPCGEAARTPSPNGGWPMGAMALRLGVRLGKPGSYCLNGSARAPEANDTARALRLCTQAAWLALAASLVITAVRWS